LNRTVLILEDRFALKDSMVNLGDRAYHVGLHNLLTEHLGHRITMGPVKALPYLTSRKTRHIQSAKDVRDLFERWWMEISRYNNGVGSWSDKIKNPFENNWLTRSNWFQKLDDQVRYRLARGAIETISPYLFRSSFVTDLIERIENADLVLFNGGAFIADHLDRYLPMVLFELYVAKKLGKPTAIVNQTVSINKTANRAMVTYLYSILDGHWVREPRSKSILEEMGIPSDRVHLSCDAAFGLPLPEPSGLASSGAANHVGICVRGDRPVRSEFWAELSKYLVDRLGLKVSFFFTSRFQDKKAYDGIHALYPDVDFLPFGDFPDLLQSIQSFDFVITDRYHATIFAILAATPFITMDSNTFKTRGLMDMVDYPIDVVNEDAELDLVVQNILRVISDRSSLSDSLREARIKLSNYARSSLETLNTL
jgi:polysaccharide pyruvyl transferase WcaK-like protein